MSLGKEYFFYNRIEDIETKTPFSIIFCCDNDYSTDEAKERIRHVLEMPCYDFLSIGKCGKSWESIFDMVLVDENIINNEERLVITISEDEICKESVIDGILITSTDRIYFVCETKYQETVMRDAVKEVENVTE